MAANNSSSFSPFPTSGSGNSDQVVYDYDHVPAGYSSSVMSLANTHIPEGHVYDQPIDPDLMGDTVSLDGSQYWAVPEMPILHQSPPGDDQLVDPSLGHSERNSSPFSMIASPSIGSDGYDMVAEPVTPPDSHASVLSLGSSYDSDYSSASNVEQAEISYYAAPPDEITNSAFIDLDIAMVALNAQHCIFNSGSCGSSLAAVGAMDTCASHCSFHLPIPYANSARLIKEESLPPNGRKNMTTMVVTKRRGRNGGYQPKPVCGKRASPEHEGPPHGDKKRKIQATNKRFCHKCKQPFQDQPSLQKHVTLEHPRPFICVFHFAGCTARFDAKNEWKRHVSTKHLGLNYWLCMEGKCGDERQSPCQRRAGLSEFGNIFNRKDLYTQHIRRMHSAVIGQNTTDFKGADARSDGMVKMMQEKALRVRCRLPEWMPCPVDGCGKVFVGGNTWDERMEHVAQQHFENAALGREPPVEFGGPNDVVLTAWASSPEICIIRKTRLGWELCDPLKGDAEFGVYDDEE